MSLRTIVEINHDYLNDLVHKPEIFQTFINSVARGERSDIDVPGIRVVGHRHHGDPLLLKIGFPRDIDGVPKKSDLFFIEREA